MEGLLDIFATFSLVFLCVSPPILSFNVDISVPIVKEGDRNSYFGYSVAQHLISEPDEPVILVGAPLGNITHPRASPKDRDLVRPGVVYSCPITSDSNDCTELLIDENNNGFDKNDMWLGVSVASQGVPEGRAVACAHRYKKSATFSQGDGYNWGTGICSDMSNTLERESALDPCSTKKMGHERYGFCQAGYSVDVSPEGEVLIGTPGPYNWRGAIFKNIIRESLYEKPTWYNSPVETPPKKDPTSVPPPIPTASNSYMGMSTTIGNVINGEKTYITGAPHSEGAGQVMLFQQGGTDNSYLEMEPNHVLTGDQFGSNFGYAIAVLDANADGKDDIVVSAPLYHGERIGGAIFVYMNGPDGITSDTKALKILSPKMTQKECDEVMCHNSKFGLSLASLGDIDLDGYHDLAVGAPFEGDGAVYIYRGSESGLSQEYSQRILSKEFDWSMTSFGSSLKGGMDMDGNGYPDLVVGAYESNTALVLRSRPVIDVSWDAVVNPTEIDPQVTRCPIDGKTSNCFQMTICFKFTAEPKDRFRSKIRIVYRLEADTFTGRKVARIYFKGADKANEHIVERTIELNEQTNPAPSCDAHIAYLIKQNRDFLNPIQVQLTYKLEEVAPPLMIAGRRLPDINDYPVLNEKKAVVSVPIAFKKNCGTDDKCQSQLMLEAKMLKMDKDTAGSYILKVISAKEDLTLQARVRNAGEDAHQAWLTFTLPEKLYLVSAVNVKDGKKISCQDVDNIITCPIGNPMQKDDDQTFSIKLDPRSLDWEERLLEIDMKVNTTSFDTDDSDDSQTITLHVVIEKDLAVAGHSHPSEVPYGGEVIGEAAVKYEDQIGFMVNHSYVVTNGPGTVSNLTVHISWPYEVENNYPKGKHLLYLLEAPVISSPGRCYLDRARINPLDVEKRPVPRTSQPTTTADPDTVTAAEENSRARREADNNNVIPVEDIKNPVSGRYEKVVTLDCDRGTAKCFTFPCVITPMAPYAKISIDLRARLWNSTFLEDYRDVDHVRIRSKARIEIDPRLNIRQNNTKNDVARIETKAVPDIAVRETEGVKLWIIIVAAVVGVLLLILLVVLLWRCGFFKRKRVEGPAHKGTLTKKKKAKKDCPDPYN